MNTPTIARRAIPDLCTPVTIVGAGPVGLCMALGLARQGVRCVLLEKKATTSGTSKAPALHVRTREIFRQWGVEDGFLEKGVLHEQLTMHSVVRGHRPLLSLDFSELADEADRPGLLLLEQRETEALLLEAVHESGLCDLLFGAEVIGLEQTGDGATVRFRRDGIERVVDTEYVVGCDGASSFVRRALGLPFEGATYSLRPMLADVYVDDERDELPQPRVWTGRGGYGFAARIRPGLWRIVHLPQGEPHQEAVSEDEVDERVGRLLGPGPFELAWASRFRIHVRSSPRFYDGRILLAGDAAHVHSPVSGYGMNGGIHDAHNLAWKLAHALRGADSERLFESYEVERRAVVVETTSRYTDRITRLFIESPAFVREGAWALLRKMMRIRPIRRRGLRRFTMLDLDYPASPLLTRRAGAAGLRLPNLMLQAPDGQDTRLHDLLPNAPVIIEVTAERKPASGLPVRHVIRVARDAYRDPTGILRRLLRGRDGWILVRPDAHVAWARNDLEGMEQAVLHALGWPSTARPEALHAPAGGLLARS
jgi:2-polyprenyl-6-methoxyphenol hydroxylase-like FAD-dependent oxidoreductase